MSPSRFEARYNVTNVAANPFIPPKYRFVVAAPNWMAQKINDFS